MTAHPSTAWIIQDLGSKPAVVIDGIIRNNKMVLNEEQASVHRFSVRIVCV